MELTRYKRCACAWAVCLAAVVLLLLGLSSARADGASVLHDIPVVQLTVDEADLWDPRTGLFAEGNAIDRSMLPYMDALYR